MRWQLAMCNAIAGRAVDACLLLVDNLGFVTVGEKLRFAASELFAVCTPGDIQLNLGRIVCCFIWFSARPNVLRPVGSVDLVLWRIRGKEGYRKSKVWSFSRNISSSSFP